MAVLLPQGMPALDELRREGARAMPLRQPPAPAGQRLRVAVLNLMPTKQATELQLARLFAALPVDIELRFLRMESHRSRNADPAHLDAFYRPARGLYEEGADGLVITGAPVEKLPFEDVDYWPELCEFMDWSRKGVRSTLHICWGAQAGLYRHYGVGKQNLEVKMFGVFAHRVLESADPLVEGFDDEFLAPHSRHTGVDEAALAAAPGVKLLAASERAGAYLAAGDGGRLAFVFGHPEYDRRTLAAEYERDRARGLAQAAPENYYPDGNPTLAPRVLWKAHARLLYSNWISRCVMGA